MKKHFVTFLSPGTFVHEETTNPIDSWDVEKACNMAHKIVERHASRPFAFQFSTRERKDDELDSRVVKESGRYFLSSDERVGTSPHRQLGQEAWQVRYFIVEHAKQ